MTFWRILTIAFTASIIAEAKWHQQQKRETTSNICDPAYNNTNHVQCYCTTVHAPDTVRSAECHLAVKGVEPDDKSWDAFENLKDIHKLTLSNNNGIPLKYIPTNALKSMHSLLKIEIKYGNIEKINAFAFANLSLIEEVTLSDNQIQILAVNAFAHHRDLSSIGLDTNNIAEINRDVFVGLPSLEKLFLTNNKITTIHDRAFVHLINLRELEIDRNALFSLNSETFSGLKKLEKLDLSGNSLEVIGDNTFLPLTNLKSLNLEENKIQMLDEKAFHGLNKLTALNLGHNALVTIENIKTFEGMEALTLLSLKSNKLVELKPPVMAPILKNFYGSTSSLDVEDNNFPCDCRLDWFMALMNKTQNSHLKLAIENLKCTPDAPLRELWTKTEELEKSGQALEEEETQAQNGDYEYYDDSLLNGKLFYIDIRDLANCTNTTRRVLGNTITKPQPAKEATTKASTSLLTTTKPVRTTDHGKATTKGPDDVTTKKPVKIDVSNTENETKNKEFTTVRLATVSAKPLDNAVYDQDMASDEARPDKIKAHRSIQDENKNTPESNFSNASRNVNSLMLVSIILCFRLYFC